MPEGATKNGWTRVAFGDVVQLSRERSSDPAEDGFERYVGLEHIEPGDLKIRRWGDIADGTTFTNVFRAGQVLFGKRRAYLRKVAVADFDGVCSGDIYVLEPKNERLLPELLPFICQTDGFFEHAVGTSAGSLSPRTNWESLASYELVLPPLEEQRRMAGALTECNGLVEALRRVGIQSMLLMASALQAALTRAEADPSTRHTAIDDLGIPGEPVLKTGPFGSKLKTSYFQKSGRPIITIASIAEDGLDRQEFSFLDLTRVPEFADYETRPGDIVFSRVADVGRCHLIHTEESGFIVSSNLIRIRVNDAAIRPEFLWLLLKFSEQVRRQIAGLTSQAAGRLLVNTETMARLRFLVPSFDIQDSVVSLYQKFEGTTRALTARTGDASMLLLRMVRETLGARSG